MTDSNSNSEPDTFTREVSLDHIDQPEGIAVLAVLDNVDEGDLLYEHGSLVYCSEEIIDPNKSIGDVYEAEIEVENFEVQSIEFKPDRTVEAKAERLKTLKQAQESDLWRGSEENPDVSVGYSDRYGERDEE